MLSQDDRERIDFLLAIARHELAYGDPQEAGTRAWAASQAAMRGYCALRDWPDESPQDLNHAADRLSAETGDDYVHLLFVSAQLLHHHFDESAIDMERVAQGIDDVRRFIDKLDALP